MYIDYSAFANCSALESLVLPEKLQYLNCSAIAGCISLKSITISGAYTYRSGDSSVSLDSLTDVYFAGTEHIWKYHRGFDGAFPDTAKVHFGTVTDIVKREAKEPTCVSEGNIEYYYCDRCGTFFDVAHEIIEPSSVIIDRITQQFEISDASITLNPKNKSGTYWGLYNEDHCPSVEVIYGEYGRLGMDVDYSVSYQNNSSVGMAYVVITGTGRFTGSVTIPYMICFRDVPMTHNFQQAVYWAVAESIGAGYSGDRTGTFGVSDYITRGHCVTFLYRLLGE